MSGPNLTYCRPLWYLQQRLSRKSSPMVTARPASCCPVQGTEGSKDERGIREKSEASRVVSSCYILPRFTTCFNKHGASEPA